MSDRITRASTAAVMAFFAMALLPRATWPLIDPDVWWHIRAGEAVLATGQVPRVDAWSLTALGHPWTSQDWLSNVLLALGYRLGPWGMTLLSLASAVLAVSAFVLLWWAIDARRPQVGWFARIAWFSAALLLAGPVLGVRVQVADLALAALVVLLLWRFMADRRRRWPALLPLVAALWVNVHAGFPILFLFGGAVAVGEALDRSIGRKPDGLGPLGWRDIGWLTAMLGVSAAALVLNPNGVAIYSYPFDTVGLTALADFVGEWQPARLNSLFGWLLLGFVVVGVVPTLLLWRRHRLRSADALLLVGVTAMSVMAVRFLLITGPIGAAVIAVNLAPALAGTGAGARLGRTLERLDRRRSGAAGVVNAALAALLLVGGVALSVVRAVPATQSDEIATEFPAAAVDWIDGHDPGDRIFNRYEWGGYLGLRRPQELIFIDGRADVYGDQIIREYVAVIGLDGDPQAVLDRYGIDHVLYPPGTAFADWLDGQPTWQRAYHDPRAAVWVRQGS